ncbi:hypothetical protein L2X99_03840 [Microbacterium sp. KUDC0406]|nr:hypothetical protein [Microbacterium sp. KUDC0406]UJP10785.1 hypothetical protein L2X99_03840 [Microbacterium sp. KUDC0406]
MPKDADHVPLRTRIKEAGGLYSWFNSRLIRLAGPASVGPYEATPRPAPRSARSADARSAARR